MKNWKLISFTSLLLLGCFSKADQRNSPPTEKQYFDYDQIEYYLNNLNEGKELEHYDMQSDSELDSLKMGVILGNIPSDTSDLTFIGELEAMGYTRNIIDESKFQIIDEIFTEKSVDEILANACIQVYRDIFVFKKGNKIVGVAKVCFDCWGHQIVGTKSNTSAFGQNGDFDRLYKLIRN